MDPLLQSREQMPEYAMETSAVTSQKKLQNTTNSDKVMFTVLLGFTKACTGTISRKHSDIISARYCERLCDRVKSEIQRKHQGSLSKGVSLLHDNAHPYAQATKLLKHSSIAP
jgi:hypothetical protein